MIFSKIYDISLMIEIILLLIENGKYEVYMAIGLIHYILLILIISKDF
jgi:hypothetical protein